MPLTELLQKGEDWLRAFNARFGMRDAFQALVLRAIQQHREQDDLALPPMIQVLRGVFGRMSDALMSFQSAYTQLEELLSTQASIQAGGTPVAVPLVPASPPVPVSVRRPLAVAGASQRPREAQAAR